MGKGVRHHTVSFLETCDAFTDFDDVAGHVLAQKEWIAPDEKAVVLDLPISRIDGDELVADDDAAWFRGGHWDFTDPKAGAFFIQKCCLIVRHWGLVESLSEI